MSITVASIYSQCQIHENDLSTVNFINLINFIHPELIGDTRITAEASGLIYLNNGQKTYTFNPSIVRIWDVELYQSVGAIPIPLQENSRDELDYVYRGWRGAPTSSYPANYYIDGSTIGLFPTPALGNGASGSPYIVLNANFSSVLGIGDSLPAQVQIPDAWVWGVLYRWAIMRHPEKMDKYGPLWIKAKGELLRFMNGIEVRYKPKLRPRAPRILQP